MRKVLVLLFLIMMVGSIQVAEGRCRGQKDLKVANEYYFDKKFDEALKLFLKAYEKGCQDGIIEYKIHYCYWQLGDKEKRDQFLKSALSKLQEKSKDRPTLENHFYLANAYFSLNWNKEGIKISQQAVEKFEKGELGKLRNALSLFQMGKIYLDAGLKEKGVEYYRRSYERFRKKDNLPKAYLLRILSHIAFRDYHSKNFEKASEELYHLVEIDPRYDNAYFYLAISWLNLGQYEKAERAWKKVIELGLKYNEEAQYNHRIARAAIEESGSWEEREISLKDRQAKELMKDEEKRKKWKHDRFVRKYKEMNDADIKAYIIEISKKAKDLKRESSSKKGPGRDQTPQDKASINKNLRELRKCFISACVAYISRGLFLRESAIKNGFAVQIMRKDAWEVR